MCGFYNCWEQWRVGQDGITQKQISRAIINWWRQYTTVNVSRVALNLNRVLLTVAMIRKTWYTAAPWKIKINTCTLARDRWGLCLQTPSHAARAHWHAVGGSSSGMRENRNRFPRTFFGPSGVGGSAPTTGPLVSGMGVCRNQRFPYVHELYR